MSDPVTAENYSDKLEEALANLPNEWKVFIWMNAYDRGHSAGYAEVVAIAKDMAWTARDCIQKHKFVD